MFIELKRSAFISLSTICTILRFNLGLYFLLSMAREVGYLPMDLKLLNICNCSHRNINLLGEGFQAFTFDLLI